MGAFVISLNSLLIVLTSNELQPHWSNLLTQTTTNINHYISEIKEKQNNLKHSRGITSLFTSIACKMDGCI